MVWGGSGALGLKIAQFKMAHSNAIKLNKPERLDRMSEIRE